MNLYFYDFIYFKAKTSVYVPILAIQPDFKPEFPSKCKTYKLSANSSINYYFGFSNYNSTAVIPGPAVQVFRFFPQVAFF